MKKKTVGNKGYTFKLPKLKPIVLSVIWSFVFVVLFAFAHDKQNQRIVKQVSISLKNQEDNHFLDAKDIESLASLSGDDNLKSKSIQKVKTKALEHRLFTSQYIDFANVYHDLSGHVHIHAALCVPILRISNGGEDDHYLTNKGKLISWSSRFTPRTLVVYGPFTSKMKKSDWSMDTLLKPYLNMFKAIHKDPIFHKLIVAAEINSNGQITLLPQIGRQQFAFGIPSKVEDKLNKIRLFYKKIVPIKGWNAYTKVNLSFGNQMVCTRY